MSAETWQLLALTAGGFVGGVVNAAAGGGSFLTLPLLMATGLPPQVANATNRVAIVLQCAAGVTTYHRHDVRPWRHLPAIAAFAVPGAVAGALLAAHVDEVVFRRAAAVLFVLMTATVFTDPQRWTRRHAEGRLRPRHWPIFLLIGLYGGFLQAGVGVLMLSTFVLAGGFDVVRGNALKFSLALVFTTVSLLLFVQAGQVRWLPGLVLAIGMTLGGAVGARLVVLQGARWVRWVVLLAAAAAVVKLLRG